MKRRRAGPFPLHLERNGLLGRKKFFASAGGQERRVLAF